ncbi:serine O-acetyltransferase [Vibrio alfacsensis]|uniref:serine O-acetyltransferase n=1 Tax=Vibrio TaxID=662 RepID=UPI0040694E10
MFLQKCGHYFYRRGTPFIPRVFDILIRTIYRCAIFSQTEIGKGTKFAYGGIGVVLHKRSKIGKSCIIGTNVTIGGRSRSVGVPVIGDNVYIATGAKVLGDISIGANCVIGANSVVLTDIPENSVVVGVPARVIKRCDSISDFR